ncbi:MAG: FAD-dependent 5-carboxymethylaminomethyl-2-thiouridine(34) oxidoreductase MnmC [Pseudomonadota bacterium]
MRHGGSGAARDRGVRLSYRRTLVYLSHMTTRLPPPPALEWTEDGAPRAAWADDIYFSPQDGLDEARAVFLRGCNLPEAWTERSVFTVAELGFGTGLNFLALWDLWRRARPAPNARLNFVSFEGFPLDREDAARALKNWLEISDLGHRLRDRWPDRARGVRRLDWPEDGVSLTLHIDDITPALATSRFQADAWFLDGFAPSKNAPMWAPEIVEMVAERSVPGTKLATFTVAGHVRRALEAAGFAVVKAPGHGRKRERLEATLETAKKTTTPDVQGLRPRALKPRRVAVVGAGVAGASAARAFCLRGAETVVYDAAAAPATGASGNPLALLMPRLDAADTAQARLLIDAYLHARATYAGLSGAEPCEVVQNPQSEADQARLAKVLADPPLGLEDLEAIRGGGLLHKGAMILRPDRLVPALLDSVALELGEAVEIDIRRRTVNGEVFDAIVVANGMAACEVSGLEWLDLTPRRGQVDFVSGAARTNPSAVASGRYVLTSGGDRLVGATFAPDGPAEPSATDRADNLSHVARLSPWMATDFERREVSSRVGVRATTPDRLPYIGAAPDLDAALDVFSGLRTGRLVDADAPYHSGVFLALGFGARGFTWGPWAGAVLAAQAFGDPAPASRPALEAVSPMRSILRGLKRGRL